MLLAQCVRGARSGLLKGAREIFSSLPVGSIRLDNVVQEPGIGTREFTCQRTYSFRIAGKPVKTPWFIYRDGELVGTSFGDMFTADIDESGEYTVSVLPAEVAKRLDAAGVRLFDRFLARVFKNVAITVWAKLIPVEECIPVPFEDPVKLIARIRDVSFTSPGKIVLPSGNITIKCVVSRIPYPALSGQPPFIFRAEYIPQYFRGNRIPLVRREVLVREVGKTYTLTIPVPPMVCRSDGVIVSLLNTEGEDVGAHVDVRFDFYYNGKWYDTTYHGGGHDGSFIIAQVIPLFSNLPTLSIPGAIPVLEDSPIEIPVTMSIETKRTYYIIPMARITAEGVKAERRLREPRCRIRFTVDGVSIIE